MRKSFKFGSLRGAGSGRQKLRAVLIVLGLLNAVALYLYLAPPGGTPQDLTEQDQRIKSQIQALSVQGSRMQLVAKRVESGSNQIADFERQYFLPKRIAYGAVIEEIERMAKLSGMQERDAGFSEEPIEGTDDLTLLNIKANYEGSYPSLMRFLYETDRSPMLLMLDSLTAAPEQKNGQISADIRFQVVMEDPGLFQVPGLPATTGAQP